MSDEKLRVRGAKIEGGNVVVIDFAKGSRSDMSAQMDRRRRHKLMTDELRKQLPKLYAQENNSDPMVVVKFFSPYSQAVWYVTEFDGEDTMFGWADLGFGQGELGYISLSELSEVNRNGLPLVERDLSWKPVLLSQATAKGL